MMYRMLLQHQGQSRTSNMQTVSLTCILKVRNKFRSSAGELWVKPPPPFHGRFYNKFTINIRNVNWVPQVLASFAPGPKS